MTSTTTTTTRTPDDVAQLVALQRELGPGPYWLGVRAAASLTRTPSISGPFKPGCGG